MTTERPTPTGPLAPELRIVESRVYRGGNIWSYDPAVHLVVDLGVLEGYPTDTIPDFQKLLLGASTGGTTNQSSTTGAGAASGGAAGSAGGGSAAGSANVSAEGVSRTTSTTGARGGGSVILSPRGKMFAHDDSRKLFVTDTISVLESIRKMLTEMDIPTKQVLIEARIVEAKVQAGPLCLLLRDQQLDVAGRPVQVALLDGA